MCLACEEKFFTAELRFEHLCLVHQFPPNEQVVQNLIKHKIEQPKKQKQQQDVQGMRIYYVNNKYIKVLKKMMAMMQCKQQNSAQVVTLKSCKNEDQEEKQPANKKRKRNNNSATAMHSLNLQGIYLLQLFNLLVHLDKEQIDTIRIQQDEKEQIVQFAKCIALFHVCCQMYYYSCLLD